MIVLYILIAILIFGALIFVHEMGHFLTARLFHVKIYEFSLGMGPKIISKTSQKSGIAYSWRLLPIGGFVSMAGEDEESDDENSLRNKKVWQRIIITAAGALTNLLIGFLVMLMLVVFTKEIGTTRVSAFAEQATSVQSGLMVGDEILRIDGHKVNVFYDMNYKISRYGTKPVTMTVRRDGKIVDIADVVFPVGEEQGVSYAMRDFYVDLANKNLGSVIKNSFYQSMTMVRMVYDSLHDLLAGKYGFEAMSGPIGITEIITDTAQNAVETKDSTSLWLIVVLLAMNLGVMNLLPLPALDGGRIVFLIIEGIRRKPISPKVEGYIHTVGLILLLILMAVVSFKDVFKLFQ